MSRYIFSKNSRWYISEVFDPSDSKLQEKASYYTLTDDVTGPYYATGTSDSVSIGVSYVPVVEPAGADVTAGYFADLDGNGLKFYPATSDSGSLSGEAVSTVMIADTGKSEPEYEGGGGGSVVKLEVTSSMSQQDIRALFASIPQDMGGKLYAVKFEPATYNFSDSLTISKGNGRLLLYSQESDSRASINITDQFHLLSTVPTTAFQCRNLNIRSFEIITSPALICKSCNFISNKDDNNSSRYVLSASPTYSGAFIRNPVIVLQDCILSCIEGGSTGDRGIGDGWFQNLTVLAKDIKWNPYNTSGSTYFTVAYGAYSGVVVFYDNITSDTAYDPVSYDQGSLGNYVIRYDASTSHQGYSTVLNLSNYFTDLTQL